MNDKLRRFYFSLRRKSGEPYKPSTLICIRAGISNRLTDAPVSRNVDIISGNEFLSANRMLKAMVGYWMNNGSNPIFEYPDIDEKDEEFFFNIFTEARQLNCSMKSGIL